jgi:hypothetical protein
MGFTYCICFVCCLAVTFQKLRLKEVNSGELPLKYYFVNLVMFVVVSGVCFANQDTQYESQVQVSIDVINGTANGAVVTNDEVIVQIFQHAQLLKNLEGKVSADGKAVFENLPAGEHVMAIPRVKHQNMMFTGPVVPLTTAEDKFTASVNVFDVSIDQSKLSVKIHHLIIKAHPKFLEITEFMQLSNSSDMAVSSAETDSQNRTIVFEIMLPKGFKNLKSSSYFEDDALVVTKDGFYDTMAVPPGDYKVTFSYTLDITSSSMDIIKEITLPTSLFMAFIESGEAQFHGLSDAEKQIMNRNGVSMEYFKRVNISPDEVVAFRIKGLNAGKNKLVTWVILSVVFGILVVLAVVRSRPAKG